MERLSRKLRELLGRYIFGTKETDTLPHRRRTFTSSKLPPPALLPGRNTPHANEDGAGGDPGMGKREMDGGSTGGSDTLPIRYKKEGEPQLLDSP